MGTGVGEAMLISAAVGAGTGAAGSAISGGDPLKGALTGAALGAVTGGVGAGISGAASTGLTAAEQATLATNSALADSSMAGAQGLSQLPAGIPNAALDANIATVANSANTGSGALNVGDAGGLDPLSQARIPPQTQLDSGIASLNNAGSSNMTSFAQPAQMPSKGLFGYQGPTPNVFEYGPQSNMALGGIGASSGITAAMQAERDKYAVPAQETYTGPLSRFKYDPNTYNPDVVRPPNPIYKPVYAAEGGIMSLAPNGMAMGGMPTRPPQTNFANPSAYEEGTSQYSMATDPYSGNIAQRMAEGGITSLGGYSDGGRLLKGPGDGMSDDIPARIGRKQEARLADGEFVVPADVVSHLGNGSTDAGAKTLYAMMNKVRKARTGTKKQGRQIESSSYLPA
jgi:hypothetical protein